MHVFDIRTDTRTDMLTARPRLHSCSAVRTDKHKKAAITSVDPRAPVISPVHCILPGVLLLRFLLESLALLYHEFLGATDHHVEYVDVDVQLGLFLTHVLCRVALFHQLRAQTVTHYHAAHVTRTLLLQLPANTNTT